MRYVFSASLALVLCTGSTFAIGGNLKGTAGESLPQFNCDRFNCVQVDASANTPDQGVTPQAISQVPVTAAPPPGQRLVWGGLGHNSCVSIRDLPTQPTFANPYELIKITEIPVPLGSTHAGLAASFEGVLAGQPGGSAGDAGLLQIKRTSSNTWENADFAYAFTAPGFASSAPILYGTGHYNGLMNLAQLAGSGQGSIPDSIDVRLAVFPQYTPSYSTVLTNQACKGRLEVTF